MRAPGDNLPTLSLRCNNTLGTIAFTTSGRSIHPPSTKSHDSQPLRPSTTTNMSGYNVLFVLVIVAALMVTSWVFTPQGPNQT